MRKEFEDAIEQRAADTLGVFENVPHFSMLQSAASDSGRGVRRGLSCEHPRFFDRQNKHGEAVPLNLDRDGVADRSPQNRPAQR